MTTTQGAPEGPAPAAPIATEEVPWTEWSQGNVFGGRSRHLTAAAVGKRYNVGVQLEELAPGQQSVPLHYHMLEEEHIYVLEGAMTLRLGEALHELRAGDYVCFPAGQRVGHCLENRSGAPCRYLAIGERKPDEVCVYPDSNKVLVRSLGLVLDRAAVRDYWDGEVTERPPGTPRR
jgi:uncharacterized cupin superfamily protein